MHRQSLTLCDMLQRMCQHNRSVKKIEAGFPVIELRLCSVCNLPNRDMTSRSAITTTTKTTTTTTTTGQNTLTLSALYYYLLQVLSVTLALELFNWKTSETSWIAATQLRYFSLITRTQPRESEERIAARNTQERPEHTSSRVESSQ